MDQCSPKLKMKSSNVLFVHNTKIVSLLLPENIQLDLNFELLFFFKAQTEKQLSKQVRVLFNSCHVIDKWLQLHSSGMVYSAVTVLLLWFYGASTVVLLWFYSDAYM